MFRSNIWNFFKLLWTALMAASGKGYFQVVELLLEQDGFDINDRDIYLFPLTFILII